MSEKCDICSKPVHREHLIPDEGDIWWCMRCIGEWEKKHNCHWENGKPFTAEKPKANE